MDHRRFRAAYDFLLLREQAGEGSGELGPWWTEFQLLAPEQRLERAQGNGRGGKGRRGGRRPRTRRSNAAT